MVETVQFDFVVTGAGSGGCAVAGRLAADGRHKVALIEAGPADGGMATRIPAGWIKLFKSKVDWDYTTEPQAKLNGRRIYWPRGRVLGGSSAINAQMYVRGAAADFDGWAEAGNPGWDYASLLPHFRASERNSRCADRFHGRDGPLEVTDLAELHPLTHAFLRAGQEIGLAANPDFNGETLDGIGAAQLTQRNGARWSAADAYLRKRPNLAVMTETVALRIIFDGRRACGVLVRQGNAERRVLAAREVLLCGGAVNSPQLLMLSGIGPAAQLQQHGIAVAHDLPGVGAHLQDHIVAGLLATIRTRDSMLVAESPGNLLRYILFRRGMLASNAAEAAAFVRSRPDLAAPDVELVFVPVLFQEQGLVKPMQHGLTIGIVALQPESRGSVRLASADPLAKPIIDPNYLGDVRDLETLRRGMELALKLVAAPAMQSVVSTVLAPHDGSPGTIEDHIRATAHTIYHPVGTCRMGADRFAVVGADLTVHGLSGLRIADASVMPRIVRGHPHAATVVIGERAAALALKAAREWPPAANGIASLENTS